MILPELLSLVLAAQGAPHVVDLDYTIALPSPPDPTATVSLLVTGAREKIVLSAVERYAFTVLPEPRLAGPVEAVDGANEAPEVLRDGPHQWTIASDGADEVTLTWRVPLTHRELDAVRANNDQYEFPYVAEDHALLAAGALLFAPNNAMLGDVRVRFDLPESWAVIAPWPEVEPGVFAPPARRNLHDDFVAVGAWRTHLVVDEDEDEGGRTEIAIAVAPGQAALEESAIPVIDAIVRAELELFGTRPFERYLFVFGRPDSPGFGGSPKAGSMTLSVAPNVPGPRLVPSIAHLVAHEFHHTWPASRGVPFPGDLRFFNEGFTDYYAYLVPARLGLAPWSGFADVLRDKLAAVRKNTAWETRSLAEAGGPGFFGRGDTYRLVYDGGLLCAAWLDLELRARARPKPGDPNAEPGDPGAEPGDPNAELGDLDALMRAFLNGDPRRAGEALPTLSELSALVERALGADLRERFERFATQPRAASMETLEALERRLDVEDDALPGLFELR